jgi:hypothetical protein
MNKWKWWKLLGVGVLAFTLAGCAIDYPKPYDYSAYKQSNPKSILVLPPKNMSLDVKATYSFYSHTQRPLAEAGYYVLPITLVDEIFKSNGLTLAHDIHNVSIQKLYDIFGADAVMYIEVKEYGTEFMIFDSVSTVTAEATLVDLRTGAMLWQGQATASSAEDEDKSNQAGLASRLLGAVINQILSTTFDQSHEIAKMTSERLLTPRVYHERIHQDGILYGPRSPLYKK